ncbi:hypothetical protein EYF80_060497 [Liparis tanakae]|uniref:Uncharacterized protein n=1 Tax=Liparis tanakae TaxID=230148 RepID=A0A4Z2EKT3_9TELE|nr:hypothetical protein EYF80_060497 [Liparis tanakae]
MLHICAFFYVCVQDVEVCVQRTRRSSRSPAHPPGARPSFWRAGAPQPEATRYNQDLNPESARHYSSAQSVPRAAPNLLEPVLLGQVLQVPEDQQKHEANTEEPDSSASEYLQTMTV